MLFVIGENESGECCFMYLFEVRIYDTVEVSGVVDKRGSDKWINGPPLFCEVQNRSANIRALCVDFFKTLYRDKYTTSPIPKLKFDECKPTLLMQHYTIARVEYLFEAV